MYSLKKFEDFAVYNDRDLGLVYTKEKQMRKKW